MSDSFNWSDSDDEQIRDEQSTDEQSTDEQSTDEQSTDEQSSDEQSSDEQSSDEQSSDEQSSDEQSSDEQSTDEQSTDEQSTDEQSSESVAGVSYDSSAEQGQAASGAEGPLDHPLPDDESTDALTATASAPRATVAPSVPERTRSISFVFVYDTNEIMRGDWKASLYSNEEIAESQLLVQTMGPTPGSGKPTGDRIEMRFPSSFGGDRDVTVQITGSIKQLPATLSAVSRDFIFDGWDRSRTFTAVVTRAEFDRVNTWVVEQSTESVEFTVTITEGDSETKTTVSGNTAGSEIAVEGGGEISGGPAKATVKVTSKNVTGWSSQTMDVSGTSSGGTKQVKFSGRRVSDAAPKIKRAT